MSSLITIIEIIRASNDNKVTALSTVLTYRWVYEKDGMLRAEVEGEDGVVKGVYTLSDQEGNVETQAYISGGKQGGHRWPVY